MPELAEAIRWHAGATWFMTGLIWFVQIVHYPLMAQVGRERWVSYEHAHQRRTTWIVAPAMLFEAFTAVVVLVHLHSGDATSNSAMEPRAISAWVATALLVVVWISTFLIQVPLHGRLSREFDVQVHRKLVRTNWIRTAAWSARSALVATLIA